MTNMNKEEMRQKLGNITQIRELLFGEKIEEYEHNFNHSQQKIQQLESGLENLSTNLARLKSDIEAQLLQIKSDLSQDINSAINGLEKKLQYLSVNTYSEINKLDREINQKTTNNLQKIELATDRLNSQISSLKAETNQNKITLEKDLNHLKQQLSETIERNLAELTETKVSRSDLAEVLFDLCLKVKGDSDRVLLEAKSDRGNEQHSNRELLLPEENSGIGN